jgi:CheY-like chemotaxis protein
VVSDEFDRSHAILLVEADELDAVRVRRELDGCMVRWVRTPDGGLAAARRDRFDALLVNVGVRGSDPRALVSQFASAAGPGIPVLVLTRIEDDRFAEELVRHGAADVIASGELHATRLVRRVRIAIERLRQSQRHDDTEVLGERVGGWNGKVVAGRFHLAQHLGAGAAGAVYRARDAKTGTDVAIKLLHPWLMESHEARARFEFEAQAGTALSHPNLVRVIDVGEVQGVFYMATELVCGGTLLNHLQTNGALDEVDVVTVFSALARGVAHAHAAGVVHRDIKPANILLAGEPGELFAKLTDFGVAKLVPRASDTMTGAVVGTLRYMAPEQFRDAKNVDHRADIYGLAATMLHAITGRAPTPFTHRAPANGSVAVVTTAARVIPGGPLGDLIERCLAEEPAHRPQSCVDVADELTALAGQLQTSRIRTVSTHESKYEAFLDSR